jgi:hypothetical protein|nr:MAG TPA: hypothetical protein [Caudoviricetes sp.]
MSRDNQYKKRRQIKEGRLEVIAQLYKRGFTIRAIKAELMKRFDLKALSTATIHRDIQALLNEWRESRLANIDDALQLELTRIDDIVKELWEQWEKSKEDYTRTQRKRKGAPTKNNTANSEDGSVNDTTNNEGGSIKTFSIEEQTQQVIGLGNPAYIAEIRQQLSERRKLLGLYAPEKRDIKGDVSINKAPCEMSVEEIEAELKSLDLV